MAEFGRAPGSRLARSRSVFFVRLPRRNLGDRFLGFCPSSPLSLITPSSTQRGRNGEVDPSATTIASPVTAYPRINWRAVELDPAIRGFAEFFPSAPLLLPLLRHPSCRNPPRARS